ncbi:MAG TPA: hypothetical protein VKW78_14755 [Terriglobales bacterium]|nr:hypothetical protein [Terriglobales bacterium]
MSHVRRRFQIALGILGAICVIAAAATIFFVTRSGDTEHQQFQLTRSQVQTQMRRIIPPASVQGRVEDARRQIDDFYKNRLATEPSAVYVELGKIAAASQVRLGTAKYELVDTELPNVQSMTVEATLNGSYVDTVKFINSLERSKMFFIVDGIALDERQGGGVHLGLKLEAYVRGKA